MNKPTFIKTALATLTTVAALSAVAAPANAACVNSVWSKTSGNSLASTINGRQCGQNMSVRMSGVVNTGWLSMYKTGPNSLRATFVDNNVTTKINMQTSGTTMFVQFQHQGNNGAGSVTTGNYKLMSYQ